MPFPPGFKNCDRSKSSGVIFHLCQHVPGCLLAEGLRAAHMSVITQVGSKKTRRSWPENEDQVSLITCSMPLSWSTDLCWLHSKSANKTRSLNMRKWHSQTLCILKDRDCNLEDVIVPCAHSSEFALQLNFKGHSDEEEHGRGFRLPLQVFQRLVYERTHGKGQINIDVQ